MGRFEGWKVGPASLHYAAMETKVRKMAAELLWEGGYLSERENDAIIFESFSDFSRSSVADSLFK